MKTKSIMLIAVSLGFGLIAAIGMSQVLGQKGGGEAEVEMAQVYVAIEPLDIGDEFTEELIAAKLKVQKKPAIDVPEIAITSSEQLENMVVTTKIPAGLMLVSEFIKHVNEAKFNKQPPKGMRAYTIKTALEDTLHNSLQAGDRVDLVGVFRVKDEFGEDRRAPSTFLKKVEVWQTNDNESRGLKDEDNNKISTITLLLTPKQVQTMILAEDVASKVRVVMSNRDDDGQTSAAFEWEKFSNQQKSRAVNNDPTSDNSDTKNLLKQLQTVDKTSGTVDSYSDKKKMTIYRGGQATTYVFAGGLPKVLEQSMDNTADETDEPTVTVDDEDSEESTSEVDNEESVEQSPDE